MPDLDENLSDDALLKEISEEPCFRCVRPIFWQTEDGFSLGATCFLVRYGARRFVITARHCLRNDRLSKLLLPVRRISDREIDAIEIDVATIIVDDSNEALDLVIFPSPVGLRTCLDTAQLDEFVLDHQSGRVKALRDGFLAAKGYPARRGECLDFEANKFLTGPFFTPLEYSEGSLANGIFHVEFHRPSNPENLGGMSGAPVFQYTLDHNRTPVWNLAGVVISGNLSRFRCIDSQTIFNAIC